MGSANWIALAAVVSVTLVDLVGPIINGIQQRRAEHERHDRDRKADTYIDVLSSLERDYAWMERTYPIIGIDRMPDPPAPLTDQEFWTLRGTGGRVRQRPGEGAPRALEPEDHPGVLARSDAPQGHGGSGQDESGDLSVGMGDDSYRPVPKASGHPG
jgi:hypothetical protein